jgi:hypothetical protein
MSNTYLIGIRIAKLSYLDEILPANAAGRPVLARARDRYKSARRRAGCNRDRVDARCRIADDCGTWRGWADVREPRTRVLHRLLAGLEDVAVQVAFQRKSNKEIYTAISKVYEFIIFIPDDAPFR